MRLFQNKKDKRIKYSIFSVWRFILYFLLCGFVVTVSFLLFFADDLKGQISFEGINLSYRAWIGLFNIIFLCIVLSIIDGVRRRFFNKKPLERILDATKKVKKGDFSTRIKPVHTKSFYDEFDIIIEDFNVMIEELSTIETLKTDFIANVSHEIKTPLSVIQNYATILQNPDIDKETRIEYAKKLSFASKKLSELITGILRLNKLENQQIFPTYEEYNLSEQICECALKFEQQLKEKSIDVSLEVDETLRLSADRELLDIVWSNLISNAIKFSDSNKKIFLKAYKCNDGRIAVTVTDNGCGMNEETKKHCFDKFYQGDKSRSTSGNGLGLALIKRVVDILNGEIHIKSELGKGCEFKIIIPSKKSSL